MISGESLNTIIEEQDYALLSSDMKKVKTLIDDCRAGKYPGIDLRTASLEQISKITGRCFNLD